LPCRCTAWSIACANCRSSPTWRADLQDQGLQAFLSIDSRHRGRLGITPGAIDTALYNAFGQRLISTIFTQSNQYRVVLEVKPEFRRGPDALKDIYVTSSSGAQVPLSAITTLTEQPALLAINHIGQFPAATISFNLAPGASLGAAVSAIEAEARRSSCRPRCAPASRARRSRSGRRSPTSCCSSSPRS